MDYAQTRELVRLRYELRRVLSDGQGQSRVDRHAAAELIRRIEVLVTADAEEAKVVVPELARWQSRLAHIS